MPETVNFEFAWEFFESTGNIESYLLYNEYKNMHIGTGIDEKYSDNGACFKNRQYE